MKVAALFSGGKDSTYAAYLVSKEHELVCLISIVSENKESYMFHTPSITKVEKQAESMGIPLLISKTKGEKEKELKDLEKAILSAKEKFKIEGIVTGAVGSVYQAERIQKICDKLELKCFNPLWKKDQIKLLQELIDEKFKVIIVGVAAYPLDDSWLGREIDEKFISDVTLLWEKYKVNPAGEGGEFETFVLNCPLFKKKLEVIDSEITGEKHSYQMEVKIKFK